MAFIASINQLLKYKTKGYMDMLKGIREEEMKRIIINKEPLF